jgi:hypothetical protein
MSPNAGNIFTLTAAPQFRSPFCSCDPQKCRPATPSLILGDRLRQMAKPPIRFAVIAYVLEACAHAVFALPKRMAAKLKEIRAQLPRRMHDRLPETGKWLQQVVRAFPVSRHSGQFCATASVSQ